MQRISQLNFSHPDMIEKSITIKFYKIQMLHIKLFFITFIYEISLIE